ncbi:MAG: PHB depolymerase family esterase [Pseudomonadota bacterium]
MNQRCGMAVLLILIVVFAATDAAGAAVKPGDYRYSITHQSIQRSYLLHLPPQSASGKPLPVVLNFHGAGGNAETQKWYSKMDGAADRDGYIAVYPNGTGGIGGRFLTWNAGSCCGPAAAVRSDDVGFALAVLEDIARRTPLDRSRIYATGLSNGSMMAYRLAAEASERIAAVAGVAGAMTLPDFSPRLPVPVMHIHSVDDQLVLFDGGLGPAFPISNSRTLHASVDNMLNKWLDHNACPDKREIAEPVRGRPGSPDAAHTAKRFVWRTCRGDTEVVLWKLEGPGHVWPGGQRDFLPELLGTPSAVIDANSEIWNFFRRFIRNVRRQ